MRAGGQRLSAAFDTCACCYRNSHYPWFNDARAVQLPEKELDQNGVDQYAWRVSWLWRVYCSITSIFISSAGACFVSLGGTGLASPLCCGCCMVTSLRTRARSRIIRAAGRVATQEVPQEMTGRVGICGLRIGCFGNHSPRKCDQHHRVEKTSRVWI